MADDPGQGISKVKFRGITGFVCGDSQKLISIGHTDFVPPWSDPNIHLHLQSEEFYYLRHGRMDVVVHGFRLSLHPNEILKVKPGVPHAVVGGEGRIEYFGMRAPSVDDKQVVGKLEKGGQLEFENERLVSEVWGHRIPLDLPQHQNCWLIGAGSALVRSEHLILAYMNFKTDEEANAGIGTRLQLHLHRRSWEFYIVLKGQDTFLVDGVQIPLEAGEILGVPLNVKHNLLSRQAPCQGFTIRVPVDLNDKVVMET